MDESRKLSDIAASLFRHGGTVDGGFIHEWIERSKGHAALPLHELLAVQTILLRMRVSTMPEGTAEFAEQCSRSEFVEVRMNSAAIYDRLLGESSDDKGGPYLQVLHTLANDENQAVRTNAKNVLRRHNV